MVDESAVTAAREALQLIAEGVTQVAGWGVAAISVARDDGYLQVMAVAGSDDARRTLEGVRTPIAEMMAELDKADDWGHLKFVPHERLDLTGDFGWVPEMTPVDAEDAWHPMDLLVAPLLDEAGTLRGTLSIDLPADGRRPGAEGRRVLNLYAEQAGRAVLTALERESLAEQVRILRATRRIVARASRHSSLSRMLAECRSAMVEGFRARGSWVQTFEAAGASTEVVHVADGQTLELSPELGAIAERAAERMLRDSEPGIVVRSHPMPETFGPGESAVVQQAMDEVGAHSLLFVPLCAAGQCLGSLVLTRAAQDPPWTEAERVAAQEIGGDLGRAVLNSRTLARQRRLVRELTALDEYRSRLISTVSHELQNPLTAILGHLELLEIVDVPDRARGSLSSVDRAARRLSRVADDLLLLSRVNNPSSRVDPVPVDLHRVARDAVELHRVTAEKRAIRLAVEEPEEPVRTEGDPDELDRVVVNLVSNAIKYSPDGGEVTLTLRTDPAADEVSLTCVDKGLGISEEDQRQLFTEFFRSTNPEAVARPGTGLGLAIASRIVSRHHGRIEVDSAIGRGSAFRVILPRRQRRSEPGPELPPA